jgi:hypothetical protein
MNQTTQSLLQEIAQTGHAVIILSRSRDLTAARDLISAGIAHIHSDRTVDGFIVIKFGTRPVTI